MQTGAETSFVPVPPIDLDLADKSFHLASDLRKQQRVFVIWTGGTIGMIENEQQLRVCPPDPTEHFKRYFLPDLQTISRIRFQAPVNLDSSDMQPSDWTTIIQHVYQAVTDPDCRGVVVMHGTDTLHYSAAATALALGPQLDKPVVFTGAQLPAAYPTGDARTNLARSTEAACSELSEVAIAFDDSLLRGARALKRDEKRFDGFHSPSLPPLGQFASDLSLASFAKRRPRSGQEGLIDLRAEFVSDKILPILIEPGLRPQLFEPLLESGSLMAIVLTVLGEGNAPSAWIPFIERASQGNVLTVLVSPFPGHNAHGEHYAGGIEARDAGAVTMGNATHVAATVKLRMALAQKEFSEATPTPALKERLRRFLMTQRCGEFDS